MVLVNLAKIAIDSIEFQITQLRAANGAAIATGCQYQTGNNQNGTVQVLHYKWVVGETPNT